MKKLILALTLAGTVLLCAQNPQVKEQVAALKQSLAANKAALQQYSWTETTQIYYKDELKKTITKMCRYGPDGQVQKTDIGPQAAPQEPEGRRLKRHIVEKKTDEMKDFAQSEIALIKQYVPPTKEAIDAAMQAGNVAVTPGGAGVVSVKFTNYVKQGDSMTLQFNMAAKSILSVNVNSYLDEPKKAVTLSVMFQNVPNGPNYAASKTLNAPSEKLKLVITEGTFQKLGQ
jgi:hypothetical protein